jgi:hypothetical protein
MIRSGIADERGLRHADYRNRQQAASRRALNCADWKFASGTKPHPGGSQPYQRWLAELNFVQAVKHIVLQDLIAAIKATARSGTSLC